MYFLSVLCFLKMICLHQAALKKITTRPAPELRWMINPPHMSHGNESMLPIQLTKTDVCQQVLCGHVRKGLNKCDK